ncbi:hypothetical protein SGPA1_12726 [Streptomyces misionensis JCM 4497]
MVDVRRRTRDLPRRLHADLQVRQEALRQRGPCPTAGRNPRHPGPEGLSLGPDRGLARHAPGGPRHPRPGSGRPRRCRSGRGPPPHAHRRRAARTARGRATGSAQPRPGPPRPAPQGRPLAGHRRHRAGPRPDRPGRRRPRAGNHPGSLRLGALRVPPHQPPHRPTRLAPARLRSRLHRTRTARPRQLARHPRRPRPRAPPRLLESYVTEGGTPDVLAERGGLPAEKWALGWHRMWAVEWFMEQSIRWINDPATDPTYIKVVRRHLTDVLQLLEV